MPVVCRCVVVMGMPFPNPTDPELCERMRYLDASASHPAETRQPVGQPSIPEGMQLLTSSAETNIVGRLYAWHCPPKSSEG